MNDGLLHRCDHPYIDVKETDPLPDGTIVLMIECLCCGATDTGLMSVEYDPRPVLLAGRWYPMIIRRDSLTVCAQCGKPIFAGFEFPVVLFIKNDDTGDVVGEVDFCQSRSILFYQELMNRASSR
jgi:hypothetical protein